MEGAFIQWNRPFVHSCFKLNGISANNQPITCMKLLRIHPPQQPGLQRTMAALGYDTNNVSPGTSTPAGVGNLIYEAVSAWFINDGARQTNGIPYPLSGTNPPVAYPDYPVGQGGYEYINSPLATDRAGIT